MGDSVPKHTGPISLTDTHLEPSVLRTRPTTTRENRRRWKGLIPRDTQAACRCNCLGSKLALQKLRCGSFDDLKAEIGGFALEIVNLQFAVLGVVKLRSSVDEWHAVAQHAIDQSS